MGQITRETCRLIDEYAERGKHYPLTVWELKQLAHAWRERERAEQDARRYRRMRENDNHRFLLHDPGNAWRTRLLYGEWLDAEVDAALASQPSASEDRP